MKRRDDHPRWHFPHGSQRMPVLARNTIATSQPLATQAGLQMFAAGGNAIDAALAAAIALTVVEPCSNGIGSDAFAILWAEDALHGWNGSGRAPRSLKREHFGDADSMPVLGWETVTTPGAVETWVRLSERFGRLPFARLFAPAILYARDGYPVSPITAAAWAHARASYAACPGWLEHFSPEGFDPKPGAIFRSEQMADTLSEISETGLESFYHGRLAAAMAESSEREGGWLTREDLAGHRGEWVAPLALEYRGATVHEIPPNGQGLATLIALGILERLGIGSYPGESADALHLQIESMKIAFQAAFRHIADPECMERPAAAFLEDGWLREQSERIHMDRALALRPQIHPEPGTVCLAAADGEGRMVSYIQSNYMGFGSGVVVPGTGIAMQNRGSGFSLTSGHPNEYAPGKRPFHTIIPGFVCSDLRPLLAFGLMGGHMQAQGHLQMVRRIWDLGDNPQAASDAPRWQVRTDFTLIFEKDFPVWMIEEMRARGHVVRGYAENSAFGGMQGIYRLVNGVYCAASDHRKDGCAGGM